MANPFAACWHRIDRAEVHRRAAADAWNAYTEGEPHRCSVRHEGGGKFVVRVIEERPSPPEMAVYMGEWLYNLRCALDYAVYAAAICDSGKDPPPGQGQLQFPCYFTEKDYRDNEYRLKPLSDYHRTALIEFMQPFKHEDPDASALGWLNKLARIDRHRRLTLMRAYLAEVNPVVGVPEGCGVTFSDIRERVIVDGQAEIGHFTITPWEDAWVDRVDVNPRTGLDPEIREWNDSPFWRRVPYNERLLMLRIAAETIVVTLEYDCLGSSRKASMLTDTFRAESDARRKLNG